MDEIHGLMNYFGIYFLLVAYLMHELFYGMFSSFQL